MSSSGVCGEEQMAGLTVVELRAMAKVRGAPAATTCTHYTQEYDATKHLHSAQSVSMLYAFMLVLHCTVASCST